MQNIFLTFAYLLSSITFVIAAEQPRPLLVNDNEWPPYFFSPSQTYNDIEYIGIAKELLNACILPSEYQINYRKLPIKRTHVYMQSGQLDLAVYSYKAEREQYVVYGKEPIFTSEYGFAVKSGSNISISSLDDLSPLIIGNLAGLAYTKELRDIIEHKRVFNQVVDSYSIAALFGQLLATPARIQIIPESKETLFWQTQVMNLQDEIDILDYQIKAKQYFVTLSKNSKHVKDDTTFLSDIDNCLKAAKNSGLYQSIVSKYGNKNVN